MLDIPLKGDRIADGVTIEFEAMTLNFYCEDEVLEYVEDCEISKNELDMLKAVLGKMLERNRK